MEIAVILLNIVPQDAVMAAVIQKHPVRTVLMHIIVQIVMAVHQAAVLIFVLVIIIIIIEAALEVFVQDLHHNIVQMVVAQVAVINY